jgi:hypothetical protein
MARHRKPSEPASPPGGPGGDFDIQAWVGELIAGRGPAEIKDLLQSLLAGAPLAAGLTDAATPAGRQAPPSRRHPRRSGAAVTYRVRIDLKDTKPPLWRRLELASDLFLDELHEVIQVAFGWTDSHLHGFASGPSFYSAATERYLCPFDVAEGETGLPEADVRLDEVLANAGDRLFYAYDYGDDWQHVIALEAVLPRATGAPRAACTAGRRRGPAEDCGGVAAYELVEAATDPAHPGHADAAAEFADMFGGEVDVAEMVGTAFDIDEINEALAGWDSDPALEPGQPDPVDPAGLRGPLKDLVGAVRPASERRLLLQLIGSAGLDQPVLVDAAIAARMVRPYSWLLDQVGDSGIKLTAAGYLPPAHVAAATAELRLREEWVRPGNREHQTVPVLVLRETAQRMGLLRKRAGLLLLTRAGLAMRSDPVALWWHLAERMPVSSRDACEQQAGLLRLVLTAAQAAGDHEAMIARMLSAIGWVVADGWPLTEHVALRASRYTDAVLRRVGALPDEPDSHRSDAAAKQGVTFARAALRTWP